MSKELLPWQKAATSMSSPAEMIRAIELYAYHTAIGETRDPRTEEEAEALAGELEKLKRHCGFLTYVPHPKQEMMHKSPALRKLMMGGNQIGKTTSGLVDDLSWAFGFWPDGETVLHPVTGAEIRKSPRVMIGAADFLNAHAETIVPKLKELIPFEVFVKRTDKIQGRTIHRIEFWNGASFKLASYESDETKAEGPTWDKVHFDEPPPKFLYIGAKRGCQKHRAPILFTMTPLSEPWIFDDLHESEKARHCDTLEQALAVEPSEIFVTTVGIHENPYISDEARADFLDDLDPEAREAREHGRFTHLMGRIYKQFEHGVHVIDEGRWDKIRDGDAWKSWPAGLVIDPHDEKPFAMAWFVITPRNERIWIQEWPEFDFNATKGFDWGVSEYRKMISRTEESLGLTNVAWRIMDPNFGKTRSAVSGNTLQEDFQCELVDDDGSMVPGYYFDCTVDNDIPSGHIAVKDALNVPRVFWRIHLKNFIKGMTHYTWVVPKGKMADKGSPGRPQQKYKDFPDLERYCEKSGVQWFDEGQFDPKVDWKSIHNLGLG